jgi:hypothetical protein
MCVCGRQEVLSVLGVGVGVGVGGGVCSVAWVRAGVRVAALHPSAPRLVLDELPECTAYDTVVWVDV